MNGETAPAATTLASKSSFSSITPWREGASRSRTDPQHPPHPLIRFPPSFRMLEATTSRDAASVQSCHPAVSTVSASSSFRPGRHAEPYVELVFADSR